MPAVATDLLHQKSTERANRSARTAELFARLEPEVIDADEYRRIVEEIVVLHLDRALSIARRYRRPGADAGDLRQVAQQALVRAVARFDPSSGPDFFAFAIPMIRAQVRDHDRTNDRTGDRTACLVRRATS